jgi:hypothetical protein
MKNRNLIALLIVVVLVALAVYLVYNYNSSTIKQELKDFAIQDTASVTKIFMADRKGNKVLLERTSQGWMVNKKYKARVDAITTLLETMNRVRVDAPVPKSAFNTTIKTLASEGTKVEIYQNDKLSKVYYVGGTTQNYKGTIMMIENSSAPFIMVIPGFEGYLTTRYFTEETLWRNSSIFAYKLPEIKSVRVEDGHEPKNSFEISLNGTNQLSLRALSPATEITNFDTLAVKDYLLNFKDLHYEFIADKVSPERKDSVLKSTPAYTITIADKKGDVNQLVCFHKKPATETLDPQGKPLVNDPDRMWAKWNKEPNLLVIQIFVFNDVFRPVYSFRPSKL